MSGRVHSITEAIDDTAISGRQKQILALCCLLAMADGFDLQVIALVLPDLANSWGVERALFGWALSAGLVGGMLGGFVMGLIGGRTSPKRVIVVATTAFALLTGCAALTGSVMQLAVVRLLAGIGLGATVPAVIAIVSAYTPRRVRSIAVTAASASQMLGGVVGGALVAPIVPVLGWQAAFGIGALLPLILLVFVVRALPDPPAWLMTLPDGPRRLQALFNAMGKTLPADPGTRNRDPAEAVRASIGDLLSPQLALGTIGLWVTCVSGAMFFYLLINWLPTFLRESGLGASTAISGSILLNAGGFFGAIALSRMMDRGRPYATIIAGYLLAAGLSVSLVSLLGLSSVVDLVVIFAIGIFGVGSYFCITSLQVHYFSIPLVGTAMGCAVGFSRAGAIIAPLVGSAVLEAGGQVREMFLAVATLATVSAAATVVVAWKSGNLRMRATGRPERA